MPSRIQQTFRSLDLEERILNGVSIVTAISIFFPWISGEWLGGNQETFNGFSFFHSFLGTTVFLLHIALLSITVVPVLGGPILVRKRWKDTVRMILATQATVLSLAALSVLTNVTFESARMEIRFGIYATFVGSFITSIYAGLKLLEQYRHEGVEHFRHPDDSTPATDLPETIIAPPPPPPPPPPLEPEEHRLH